MTNMSNCLKHSQGSEYEIYGCYSVESVFLQVFLKCFSQEMLINFDNVHCLINLYERS